MTENEAKQKLENLHYKIIHTSFCNKVYEIEIVALCMAKDALEEIQQYRAIGTIDEFKALKEKNTPKKVAYQVEHEKCPTCGSFHVFGKHCTECGQAVDYD